MTVNAQSRAEAFDISRYFAPEIIDPTKPVKGALVFGSRMKHDHDFEYELSKFIDHPVKCDYRRVSLSEVLPRGIPWHDFPIVSAPFYKTTGNDVPNSADVIVVGFEKDPRERALLAYEVAYLLDKLGHEKSDVVIEDDRAKFVPSSLCELKKPFEDELRFHYSYTVNFKAIAAKALSAVGAKELEAREIAPLDHIHFCSYPGVIGARSEPISHPLALQWLYRLRALGTFGVPYASECIEFRTRIGLNHFRPSSAFSTEFFSPMLLAGTAGILKNSSDKVVIVFDELHEKSPDLSALKNNMRRKGVDFTAEGTSRSILDHLMGRRSENEGRLFALDEGGGTVWRGTGKYPALPPGNEMASMPLGFLKVGLVSYDFGTKSITLSDKGHRFLDLLHPDCEDPDVLLRWMGPDGLFKDGVGKSCDDWIMRFFSKMKTRVNEIDA